MRVPRSAPDLDPAGREASRERNERRAVKALRAERVAVAAGEYGPDRRRRRRKRSVRRRIHALGLDLDPTGFNSHGRRGDRHSELRLRRRGARPKAICADGVAQRQHRRRRHVGLHCARRRPGPAGLEADRQHRERPATFGSSVALSADGNSALIGASATANKWRGVGVHPLGLDLDPAGPKLTASSGATKRPATSASTWRCRPTATPR